MNECKLPPAGWRCTREAGHEGPCAALPIHTQGMIQRIIRYFHNKKRLKENHKVYAYKVSAEMWSRTCHTVGDRIWTHNIGDAEPMHVSEFGSYSRVGRPKDPMRLLRMEGWTDVWLYTEQEWKVWRDKDDEPL